MTEAGGTLKNLFVNDEGELRSLWRVLVFILVFQVVFWVIGGFLGVLAIIQPAFKELLIRAQNPVGRSWPFLLVFLITQVVTVVAVLVANGVCARWLERRSFASTGFKLHPRWWRDFLLGSLLGGATLAVAVAIAATAGATRLQVSNADGIILLQSFGVLFVLLLISAANEEALVRGFAFQAVDHNLGPAVAVAATSVIFGLLHLQNSNVTVFSTLNTMLAGVWLGVAYLQTRSLWLATALHYSWNLVMAFVFGLPVSGITDFRAFAWLQGESTSRWISGAEYGPEGGVAATLALLLSTLLIWKSGLFKTSAEMALAIRHGKPEKPPSIIAEQHES